VRHALAALFVGFAVWSYPRRPMFRPTRINFGACHAFPASVRKFPEAGVKYRRGEIAVPLNNGCGFHCATLWASKKRWCNILFRKRSR